MKSIRTELPVTDKSLLELFLKANNLETVNVGHYEERRTSYQVDNKICYLYDEKNEAVTTILMYMALKYGSLEMAFEDFKKKLKSYM